MSEDLKYGVDSYKGLLESVLKALPQPFFIFDKEGKYVDVLGGIDRSKYHSANPLIGKYIHDVIKKDEADKFVEKINESINKKSLINYEYQLSSDDVEGIENTVGPGNKRCFEGHIYPIFHDDVMLDLVVWIAFDITQLKKTIFEKEILAEELKKEKKNFERLSSIDALTEVNNRRNFDVFIKKLWFHAEKEQENISLIMIDIDFFKKYNDFYGHPKGDECLIKISKEIKDILKKSMDMFFRYGGEEFSIISLDSFENSLILAEKIRKKIEELEIPHVTSPKGIVTISLGLANLIPNNKNDYKTLINMADKALYVSKKNGRNIVST